MNNINQQIRLYNDLMLIEAFLKNKNEDYFIKNAFSFSSFFDSVKNYFSNKVDPNNPIDSVVNFMAPGLIFRALGLGKLGFLLGTVASFMGIDIAGMTRSVWKILESKVKSESVTQSDIDGAVKSIVNSQNATLTEEQRSKSEDAAKQMFTQSSLTFDDVLVLSKLSEITQKSILAGNNLNDTHYSINKFTKKYAKSGVKWNLIQFSGKIIGFIISAAIAALGINLLGDVAKKMTGHDNAFDGANYTGAPKQKAQRASIKISKQNVFPLKSSYSEKRYNSKNSSWIERSHNTTSSIINIIIGFANEVYDGLDGLTGKIKSSNAFMNVIYDIEDYNISAAGDNFVFIPTKYKSKKQLVDHFIDDVAKISEPTKTIVT